MRSIKPNNTRVSNDKATRRLNLEDEQFHVGDALASPRVIPQNHDFGSSRKTTKEHPDEMTMTARSKSYNNRSSMKNGRRSDRNDRSLKFGKSFLSKLGQRSLINKDNDPTELSYIKPWRITSNDGVKRYMGEVPVEDQPYTMLDDTDYVKRLKFE